MARPPKLGMKKIGDTTYRFTKAGGDTYFGNAKIIPYMEAQDNFNEHLVIIGKSESRSKGKPLIAGEFVVYFGSDFALL